MSDEKRITFDSRHANGLYASGNYDELSDYFLNALDSLHKLAWDVPTQEQIRFVDIFLKTFFHLFTQENYLLNDISGERFIRNNTLISNLAAISSFVNTDPWLELIRHQQANFVKILTLLNARCKSRFKIAPFFTAHPKFATLWYTEYFELFHGGTPTKTIYENALRHVAEADPRWEYSGPSMSGFYFFPTYFAIDQEARLKKLFHDLVKPIMDKAKIKNNPNPRSIAIVTARWTKTSAVYKVLSPFVESLRHDFDLTLVRVGNYGGADNFDKSWFKAIKNIGISGSEFNLGDILENDFSLAYFPDIGMQADDRHLCNIRIAPIQVMGYGHPASTHGSEIDYIVGGQEVELLEDAQKNYSERLVTVPGIGAYPILPDISQIPAPAAQSGPMIIGCSWAAHKCTYPHLLTLARIAEKAKQPVRFRIFCAHFVYQHNALPAFRRDMVSVLGDAVEVIPALPYDEYLRLLSEGAFSLDSWPFGGYNTIVDSLAVGKPVVTLEGHHAPNRIAAAALRRVGLEELVAKTPAEFASISLKLINDDSYRDELIGRLAGVDLDETLCRKGEADAFKRAIEYLIENHRQLKAEGSRQPIVIK